MREEGEGSEGGRVGRKERPGKEGIRRYINSGKPSLSFSNNCLVLFLGCNPPGTPSVVCPWSKYFIGRITLLQCVYQKTSDLEKIPMIVRGKGGMGRRGGGREMVGTRGYNPFLPLSSLPLESLTS